jgi:hypothetical protein
MPRRLSGSSIAVSFSTRGTLMPAWMVQHIAAVASVDGVDVDVTSPLRAWLASCFGAAERPYVPVRSIWVPIDGLRSPRNRRLIDTLASHQPDAPPRVIAVLPNSGSVRDLARVFDPTWSALASCQIAIGLAATGLKGGRPHLVQLGGIRRFAEEWDLAIAVDLAGRFDPTWEAEAAVARLGDRLAILRLSATAPSRAAVGRDRVACRALHAAIDRAPSLDVALSAPTPVPFPATPRAAAHAAQRAIDYIAERATLHAQALREDIDRYEGSPSSRGN